MQPLVIGSSLLESRSYLVNLLQVARVRGKKIIRPLIGLKVNAMVGKMPFESAVVGGGPSAARAQVVRRSCRWCWPSSKSIVIYYQRAILDATSFCDQDLFWVSGSGKLGNIISRFSPSINWRTILVIISMLPQEPQQLQLY